MSKLYKVPLIVDPVPCDRKDGGVPSDHRVPVAYPVTEVTLGKEREVRERTTRPLPQSGVEAMVMLVEEEDWAKVRVEDSTTEQDKAMQDILICMMDRCLPTKTVKLRSK